MKKLSRQSLDQLAEEMMVLNKEKQQHFVGGGRESCVFNCFDYLDGGLYTADHYYNATLSNLGYEPGANGGVSTSDISTIGSFGGFDVQELTVGFNMSSDGYTNGCRMVMSFNHNGIDHAVVVTGYEYDDQGRLCLKYYDPTFNITGQRIEGDYSGIYSVGPLYIDSSVSSGNSDYGNGSYV